MATHEEALLCLNSCRSVTQLTINTSSVMSSGVNGRDKFFVRFVNFVHVCTSVCLSVCQTHLFEHFIYDTFPQCK